MWKSGSEWQQNTFKMKTTIGILLTGVAAAFCANGEVKETGPRQMVGTKNVLTILVQTPDSSNVNSYAATISAMNLVASRTAQSSYNRLILHPEVVPSVLMLPHTAAYYNAIKSIPAKYEALRVDAVNAASQVGYAITPSDYMNYDRVVIVLPRSALNINDYAYHTVFVGNIISTCLMHELGHDWLFQHSGLWKVTDGNPISPNGTLMPYGDVFDIMGDTYALDTAHDYNLYHKYWAGWIDDSQVATVATKGTYTYTISRFDNVNAIGLLAIKIPVSTGRDYWVSFMRNFLNWTDAQRTSAFGAYILRVSYPHTPPVQNQFPFIDNRVELIDTQTPGANPGDACLPVGKTFNDAVNGITITTVAQGGTAPFEWIKIRVKR